MGIITFIRKRCRDHKRASVAALSFFVASTGAAQAACPLDLTFASVSKDGHFFDSPGGRAVEQFSAGDVFDYSFVIVDCKGGWVKALYYGDNSHRWLVADNIGRLSSWVAKNRVAVDEAVDDAAGSGASGVSNMPRLSN